MRGLANMFVHAPQGGAAHSPVYIANNPSYQVHIRGPDGYYDPMVKPVTPSIQRAVDKCYRETGDAARCAHNGAYIAQESARGNVNANGVSYVTGEYDGRRRPCHCLHRHSVMAKTCGC